MPCVICYMLLPEFLISPNMESDIESLLNYCDKSLLKSMLIDKFWNMASGWLADVLPATKFWLQIWNPHSDFKSNQKPR